MPDRRVALATAPAAMASVLSAASASRAIPPLHLPYMAATAILGRRCTGGSRGRARKAARGVAQIYTPRGWLKYNRPIRLFMMIDKPRGPYINDGGRHGGTGTRASATATAAWRSLALAPTMDAVFVPAGTLPLSMRFG